MRPISRFFFLVSLAILAIPVCAFAQTSPFLAAPYVGTAGFQAKGIALADLNGDGILDLVTLTPCTVQFTCAPAYAAVSLGNGDGTFKPAVTYGTGPGGGTSVTVRDVNGDGKPDLIVSVDVFNYPAAVGGVSILLGNGDGTFQPAVSYASGGGTAYAVALADTNADGKLDVIVANECPVGNIVSCSANGVIGVLLGNGDGTFQAAVSYSSGRCSPQSIAAADLNGDGSVDLLIGSFCNVSIMFGAGDGTFQPPSQILASGGFVAAGDVNGDGKIDVLVDVPALPNSVTSPSGTIDVLVGDGHGTFTLTNSYAAAVSSNIVIADVNGDGKPDLVVGASCNTGCETAGVGIFLGNGDGTFQAARTYESGGEATSYMAVGDIDGDGNLDIAVTNQCAFTCNASHDL